LIDVENIREKINNKDGLIITQAYLMTE